ncbi:MAG: LysM peptidoglycan-binding domain-containing protein [bacterium]
MTIKKSRRMKSAVLPIILVLASCARFPEREISDARVLMEAAKNSCARVYTPDDLEEGKNKLTMIEEGTRKETRKPNRQLKDLALDVQHQAKQMINQAARIKSDLYDQIQQQIVLAIKKIHEGEKAEANRYALKEYLTAVQSVREARELSQDECRYKTALEKATESVRDAEQSVQKAMNFKKRLENNLPVYHIVHPGETLKSIARNSPLYGDESYWELIYKANRDQIADPKVLHNGQQLYLPGKK